MVFSPIVFYWFEASVSVPSAHNHNGRLTTANALAEPTIKWRREIEEFKKKSQIIV